MAVLVKGYMIIMILKQEGAETKVNKQYVDAREVAAAAGVSVGKAYEIIRELNNELKSKGFIVIAGKCPRAFFKERYYGFQDVAGD